mmetsp:Transcript_35224/g.108713  ORF Transcript_35224/g.108713 Transcript_35224/m.108713 type:complete len:248 (-) Transcript_35224:66-809(-)
MMKRSGRGRDDAAAASATKPSVTPVTPGAADGAAVDKAFAEDPEEYAASVQGVIDGVLAELDRARDDVESRMLFAEHDDLTNEMQQALTALRNAPRDGSRETAAMREQLILQAWTTQMRREFNMEKMLALIERKLGRHGFMHAFLDDVVYLAEDDINRLAHANARTVGRFKFDRARLVRHTAHVSSLRVADPSANDSGLPALTARSAKPVVAPAPPPTRTKQPPLTARERYRKLHRGGLQLPAVTGQ